MNEAERQERDDGDRRAADHVSTLMFPFGNTGEHAGTSSIAGAAARMTTVDRHDRPPAMGDEYRAARGTHR